jgi:hypothetical protein
MQCDYCLDIMLDGDDILECDCGLKWCSLRCARLNGWFNKKTSSTCDFCRNDSPGSLSNYLLPTQKGELLSHTYE